MKMGNHRQVIVIDTREQLPFIFSDEIETVTKALSVGDYSLLRYENLVSVERKSLADYISSLTHQRKRFFREIKRLADMPYSCVIVEASLMEIMQHRYRSGATPSSILGSTISIIVDYSVPVYFCSDRQIALAFTERFLKRVHRKVTIEKEKEFKN